MGVFRMRKPVEVDGDVTVRGRLINEELSDVLAEILARLEALERRTAPPYAEYQDGAPDNAADE